MPFIAGKVGHRFGTLGRFSQSLSLKPLQKTHACTKKLNHKYFKSCSFSSQPFKYFGAKIQMFRIWILAPKMALFHVVLIVDFGAKSQMVSSWIFASKVTKSHTRSMVGFGAKIQMFSNSVFLLMNHSPITFESLAKYLVEEMSFHFSLRSFQVEIVILYSSCASFSKLAKTENNEMTDFKSNIRTQESQTSKFFQLEKQH